MRCPRIVQAAPCNCSANLFRQLEREHLLSGPCRLVYIYTYPLYRCGRKRNNHVIDGCLSIEKEDVEKNEKSHRILLQVVTCEYPSVKTTVKQANLPTTSKRPLRPCRIETTSRKNAIYVVSWMQMEELRYAKKTRPTETSK